MASCSVLISITTAWSSWISSIAGFTKTPISNYARDQVGKPQEIPIEFYCEIPAPEIAPIDDGLWRVVEDNLTYKQFEAIQFRNQGYTNREIAELCGVGRKAIEKRFARIRKILSDYKEN